MHYCISVQDVGTEVLSTFLQSTQGKALVYYRILAITSNRTHLLPPPPSPPRPVALLFFGGTRNTVCYATVCSPRSRLRSRGFGDEYHR